MQIWLGTLIHKLRPQKGWTALLLMVALQIALAGVVRQTEWVNFKAAYLPLEVAPVAGLLWLWLFLRPLPYGSGIGARTRRVWAVAGALLLGVGLWLQQVTNIAGRWLQWRPAEYAGLDQLIRELGQYVVQEGASAVAGFAARLSFWVAGVQGTGAQQDDLILIAMGSMLLLLLALQSTFMFLQGKSVFLCLMPSLAVLAYVLYFSQGSRFHLLGYLALLFTLFAWSHQQELVKTWQQQRVDYPEGIALDRAVGVGSALLVMGLTAGFVPSLDVAKLTEWVQDTLQPVDEVTSDFGERMFPDLQSQVGGQNRRSAGGLPNSFLLGDSPDLSTQVVMHVTAGYPFAEERGFYMRGTVYEQYDGRGWSNPDPAFGDVLDANTRLALPAYPYRREVWQAVQLHTVSSLAYAIADPIQFSVNVRPETNQWGAPLFFRNLDRDSYSVLSAMPLWSDVILREVSWDSYDEIPPESLAPYLTLPTTVTERTLQLARELGQTAETPYDLGLAVETYLRQFPYDLQVALPGTEVPDVADYFLFDLGRGYCDYYTTAFVVLMRSRGVPVRFAAGYAPGYFTEYTEEWVITDAQAHSWPEAWFPGLGWVPFEPTAGRQALDRSYVPVALEVPDVAINPESKPFLLGIVTETAFPWKPVLGWSAFLLALLALMLWPRWRPAARDPWTSLLHWGRRLGQAKWSWETESEFAGRFLRFLAAKDRIKEPDARAMRRQIRLITAATVRIRYAPEAASDEVYAPAARQWQNLQSRLRRIYFLRY